tara:strand:- start:2982 stop:4319 length:1338 start_codon:yes stop_codon:yes gene_type:complete
MKLFYATIILLIFNNCSFDNKSGIWKNESYSSKNDKTKNETYVKLNKLLLKDEGFDKKINLDIKFIPNLSSLIDNSEWNDSFYDKSNNLKNFKYSNLHNEVFEGRKLSKNKTNEYLLFSNEQLIISDQKGNIIFFSINENRIINKFNFYKKKYKNLKKKLNLILNGNTIYVSDNMGYLYSYDIRLNKVIWAKNYKIPFRSNLKIHDNKIFASNLNNDLLIIDKVSGDLLKQLPTEPTVIKNNFKNNFALDEEKTLFFLNSYGSLYAIDLDVLDVKWFLNLNSTFDLNPSNLFASNQIIYQNKKIIISSQHFIYIIDSNTGSILYKNNFSTYIRPIINNDYLFLISKNNFLISLNLSNLKILYSYNIDEQIANFLDIKKKKVKLKSFLLANNEILILLSNSYILNFDIKGKLKKIKKLNSKLSSQPIFIEKSLLYLDNKNKLIILN